MNLRDRVALVTGGGVRIGGAIVHALAREGADVVIHCNRSTVEARRLAGLVEKLGRRAFVLRADLRSETACLRLVPRARKAAGRLDVLVNNAAVFHKDGWRGLTAAKLREEFEVNLYAPLLLMSAFQAAVRRGAVVNLLDRRITGLDSTCVPYVLAKKALAEATRMAALDMAPRLRVNAVAPGAILPPPGRGMDYLRDKAGPVPLRRSCTPDEVADAVLFLLKNEALTGQIVFVDGGQHIRMANSPEP